MFVPTIAGGGAITSETPAEFVITVVPGGRFTATGSRGTVPLSTRPKFVPTVLFTPTGPGGKVDGGKPPAEVTVFVTTGVGNVLEGGKRKVGWMPLGSTIVSVGPPPIIPRSNVRPTVVGGRADMPPGLIVPTGAAVPGVAIGVPDGVVGVWPASAPLGLIAPVPATPALRAPLTAADAPTEDPAAALPEPTWAERVIGSAIETAKVPKIAFMKKPRPARRRVNSGSCTEALPYSFRCGSAKRSGSYQGQTETPQARNAGVNCSGGL
jgi:hypothetical protein